MTTVSSTNAATGIITRKSPRGGASAGARRRAKIVHNARLYAALLALMIPTLVGMVVFTYYPQWGAIKHSFYNWDGGSTVEFVGWKNFTDALFIDQKFWPTFQLVGVLLVANLFKMWPSIFAAIALHRIRSDRAQYLYRVLFVIPMIIPALVGLLVWKTFFDSTTGVLNVFLRATGLMSVLNGLDGVMPAIATALAPAMPVVRAAAGSVWGLALLGVMALSVTARPSEWNKRWVWWSILTVAAVLVWLTEPWRIAVALGVVVVVAVANRPTDGRAAKVVGVTAVVAAAVLILFGMIWTAPTRAFETGMPAWLGHSKLIIPSLIFWDFPWVGTVGVLIYLAGLQNISNDVYEAAELDGLGSFGKLWSLELPLILTQVRINLIFMTIGTLTDYHLVFLLLGPDGGPGGVGNVPGLYMYRQAFVDGRFGYSCALGMILFVLILAITVFYQKYVKVDK